jgi:hypothetical protein
MRCRRLQGYATALDAGADALLQRRRIDTHRKVELHLGLTPQIGHELGRRPGRPDLAADDDRRVVRERLGLLHVVRGEEHRGPAIAQPRQHVPCLPSCRGVKSGRRLVEEDELGAPDEAEADVEPALLPAGELADALVVLLGETHELHHLVGRSRRRVVAREEIERLTYGVLGLHAAVLEHDADPSPPRPRSPPRVLAEHLDGARIP